MAGKQIKKTKEQKIRDALERNPNRSDSKICDNIKSSTIRVTVGDVRAMREKMGIPPAPSHTTRYRSTAPARPPAPTEPASGGISLRGVRISTHKPTEEVKRRLYQLKRGTGFPLDALSKEWGVSPDTIKKHARRYDCLRFVERGPGDWVACVLNPDTVVEMEKQAEDLAAEMER